MRQTISRATILLCLLAVPAFAQTPTEPAKPAPVPLPQWFVDMDTAKKGEISRTDFVKYRMRKFDELDTNKDGKVSLDEFLKLAEPPYAKDVPGGPNLDERRVLMRTEFQNFDTDRDGFIDRAEAEAPIQAEFNQYDTDRDNKISEPEIRLIVQRSLQRQEAERQQAEVQRRRGKMAINDLIDMQMRDADKLDKNGDGRITQQEYLALAGPADGPQSQGMLPFEVRKQLVLSKFQAIDANKDDVIDRPELTAYAVKEFLEADLNKDRFLDQEEIKKFEEANAASTRELVQKLKPPGPPPAQPRPAPPRGAHPPPTSPLPQGTR